MPAEDQRLHRQQQRLDTQDHRMHEADGVDGVEPKPAQSTEIGVLQRLVVAGVGALAIQLPPWGRSSSWPG